MILPDIRDLSKMNLSYYHQYINLTTYYIYKEDNDEYSVGMEDDDKIPLSAIDYASKETIIKSIENYYKNNGGMCP